MNNDQTKTHTLTEAERRHIAEVQAQMAQSQEDILKLKGAIYDKERELSFMRRHLSLWLGNIAQNAGLPMGSALSADGTALIAREQ